MYPGKDCLDRLFHDLGVSPLSKDASSLLTYSRRLMRGAMIRRGIKITREQRAMVRKHIEKSAHGNDVPLLCDELQTEFPHVPREILYKVVYNQCKSLATEQLTEEQKENVRDYVERCSHPQNISQICEELQPQFESMPNSVLYHLVRNCAMSLSHQKLTAAQKQRIEHHVANARDPLNTSKLCDDLQHELKVSRLTLYRIVNKLSRKMTTSKITREERLLIKKHIDQSPNIQDTLTLTDELEKKMHNTIPRRILTDLVRDQVRNRVAKRLSKVQRQRVREHVAQSLHPDDTSRLRDEIQKDLQLNVPHPVLNQLIRNARTSISNERLSTEQKEEIKRHMEQLDEQQNDNHAFFIYHLQKNVFPQVPKDVLNQMVSNHLRMKAVRALNSQQRRIIMAHMRDSPHPHDIPLLCDELQEKISNVPRSAFYDLLHSQSKKRRKREGHS